jgi:hypothetical protein
MLSKVSEALADEITAPVEYPSRGSGVPPAFALVFFKSLAPIPMYAVHTYRMGQMYTSS